MTRMESSHLVSRNVREHNMSLVLSALDERGPLARAELAAQTGLARGAVTMIVNDLIELGLVRPAATSSRRRPGQVGRSLTALEIDGSDCSILAVQFGVDEFLIEAVDLAGRPLLSEIIDERTPFGDPEALIDLLADKVRRATARLREAGTPPLTLRIVAQAPIASESDSVWIAVNLGWHDVDLRPMLRARLPEFPHGVRVVNDSKMATYAEWLALRSRYPELSIEDIIYIKSDTGIGGGAISSGEPLVARNGLAFEPGHQVVLRDGPRCTCGQFGCLEVMAGPDIVLKRAGLAGLAAAEGFPAALAEFVRRVKAGDHDAVESWTDAAGWIRMSISGLIVLLQPQAVVIGGYWADLAADLLPPSAVIREVLNRGGLGSRSPVRGSALGHVSAVMGALALARHELFQSPALLGPAGSH